ncbi:MAG: hypothetical protein OCC49_09125 [Fibrobacterales bacterium]
MIIFISIVLLFAFSLFFMVIFFQFNKLEKRLDKTVSFVESYLLNKFGEVKESIKEDKL